MTNEEIAWLAGVLDSEGCFDFNGSGTKYPRIRIEMKDEDVIERIKSLCECGGTIRKVDRSSRSKKHSNTWQYQICSRKDVKRILLIIYPWMSIRRKLKIDEMLFAL